MTPITPGADAEGSASDRATRPERRHNAHLRELVDEMLASIRAAANVDLWTPEERARCEDDMARIMATVRAQAVRRDPPAAS
ncbi:MAG: hypothetical protein LCH84_08155 [Gemmatimonadetes bacterium]|nr:hypothetical protein [Gemmatimonadota bacterium]